MEYKFKKIFDINKFVIVSFYSNDKLYNKEKDYFIYSLNKFKINYIIYEVNIKDINKLDDIQKWNFFTYLKPKILKKVLQKYKFKSILWCDIDSMFFNYPTELDTIDKELGLYDANTNNNKNKLKLLSGVIFLKNTKFTINLLDEWISKINNINLRGINDKNFMNLCDQKILTNIIEEKNIPFFNLTKKYFGIYNKVINEKKKYSDYYVVHFQASRRKVHKLVNEKFIDEDEKVKIYRNNIFDKFLTK